jgi:hypothetical protein
VFMELGVDLVLALRDDLVLAAPMAIVFVALLIAAYRIFDPAGAAGDRSRSAPQR